MGIQVLGSVFRVSSFVVLALVLFSCESDVVQENTEELKNDKEITTIKIHEPVQDEEVVTLENKGITLTEIKTENNLSARLTLTTTSFKEGENELDFKVEGIDAYSIAVIENNYAVSHYHQNNIQKEFLFGNNVFLAFLTHPNGISVKTNKALLLKNVLIEDENLFNMYQPHLFYYLPKATTNAPILDFCLINTSIAENGNKVKISINEIDFIITKWAAYQIEGLPTGNHTIRIQLIDKAGKLIEGPFNDSGERDFVVQGNGV